MKKLSLILVVAIMFASCKKDDEPQNQTEEPPVDYYAQFVGSWDLRWVAHCDPNGIHYPPGTQTVTFNVGNAGAVQPAAPGPGGDSFACTVSNDTIYTSDDTYFGGTYWTYSYSGDTLYLQSNPIGCSGVPTKKQHKLLKL